ncbi:DUF1906 domain-containing protein [Streptomyces sp. H39-S7]|uniref:DUF1906 domain-containing protein n=1 Tax=Streptomyces sp. H39-S7 TaxID=3004357 RepID=UPI0022B07CE3|nr:DUF1906 domain-containing protein [Streptomyces sp. H39-S7]MCZ4123492.1 DUF1906 domain-containing protein [Streptomyces sp. H39-S7]
MRGTKRIIRYFLPVLSAVASLACLVGAGVATADPNSGSLRGARFFEGAGFETCGTPSADTMQAWRGTSPYGAVGVYFGGRARACAQQPNLTPSWVRTVDTAGWSILPIYVGSQAPCTTNDAKKAFAIDSANPGQAGTNEAKDAVDRAHDLGFVENSALYLDMEAYDIRIASCTAATLAFVQSWDREVRRLGYIPGFYSSADSGIAHMEQARNAGAGDLPSVVWYARWNVPATLEAEPALSRDAWQPHSRIHQYAGNVTEQYGGRTITIDRDLLDAPVAVIG